MSILHNRLTSTHEQTTTQTTIKYANFSLFKKITKIQKVLAFLLLSNCFGYFNCSKREKREVEDKLDEMK
jgi:hypothetical protein